MWVSISSRVHSCATEYGQLIMTFICANLSNYLDKLAYVQVVTNCQYSIAQICNLEQGTVALWSNAPALDWKIEGLNLAAANSFF